MGRALVHTYVQFAGNRRSVNIFPSWDKDVGCQVVRSVGRNPFLPLQYGTWVLLPTTDTFQDQIHVYLPDHCLVQNLANCTLNANKTYNGRTGEICSTYNGGQNNIHYTTVELKLSVLQWRVLIHVIMKSDKNIPYKKLEIRNVQFVVTLLTHFRYVTFNCNNHYIQHISAFLSI